MSKRIERSDHPSGLHLESGLEALRQSPEFQGPVESRDAHEHSNDHFALIYENRDEQFAAAIPFIRQGLEQGERCLYVADENSSEDVLAAMRDHGIDVDTALDSGALSVLAPADTYRRTGEFDRDAMLEFWEDSLEQATDEGDYTGIRAAAEMTWALESDTNSDQLVEYEAMLNPLYEDEDYVVLCQYNRERFSPKVIYDVIRTHPLLIHDNVLSHNVYYTPPEEFFGPEQPAREIDRMIGTLRERAEAKSALKERKEHFKRVFESTNDALLIVDPSADEIVDANPAAYEILGYTRDELLSLGPSDLHPDELDRFRRFVGEVLEDGAGWTDELTCDTKDRGRIPAEISASRMEYNNRRVVLAAVRDISERRKHEQAQRRLYELAADTDLAFDEKLQIIFELGCDRFDIELGGIARVDVEADAFEVETICEEHDHLIPGKQYPLSETYCRLVTEDGETATVTDPTGSGFEEKLCYDRFGVQTYLGTYLEIEGDDDRTFFFLSNEPREEEFSESERTFHHLMGQWVKYELERRQRERFLRESYDITSDPELSFEEKLERLLNLGCEWFDLEMAALSQLPSWDGKFRLEKGVGLPVDPEDEPLWAYPGEGCFCRLTITEDSPVSRVDVRGTDWAHDPIYREFGLTSYLGTKVTSGSMPYGTLWFGSTEPRGRSFSNTEYGFIELMSQWVSYEIERREHKQSERELYEITADSKLSFEEKVDRVLDLGRERFGLDMGFFLEKQEDQFGVVKTRGTDLEEGVATLSANPGHYCKKTVTLDVPVGVEDTEAAGWDDDPLYREYGLGCYLGTRVTGGTDVFGSVCFADSSSREMEFTDADYTFLDLMGQWLSYELERQQYEQDLQETIDQLQQSNDRLKQFAYASSHDLQEPLRMVSSYLQLLEKKYEDHLDDEAQEYIDFAVDGADRMREMVDDLLAYSRIEQSDGEFESVDCDMFLDQVTADLEVQIEENNAEIVADPLPTVIADSKQLEQLFSNLVSNAIKYNDSDPPRVEITAEDRLDNWEFSITDNGIGIDPEKSDKIFEVFKRLHHEDEYPGTGIGLSLCQEIVDNHGGDIRVESEPGEGSTFYVTLPRRVTD